VSPMSAAEADEIMEKTRAESVEAREQARNMLVSTRYIYLSLTRYIYIYIYIYVYICIYILAAEVGEHGETARGECRGAGAGQEHAGEGFVCMYLYLSM